MSHEIRTPLNAIIGFSDLALQASLPPREHDFVQKIHTAGESLLAIIGDILDFSKIEAGQMQMEETPFGLDTVLANACALVQQKATDKGLRLRLTTVAAIPPCLLGDPHRLSQILVNLLNNAVKFTEHGEVELTTAVLAQENERLHLQFAVRDAGIGISGAELAKLFQPFVQADGSTTRRFGGTGLGLSISKKLAELMGGEIACDSTQGQGSTFTVTAWFGIGQASDLEQSSSVGERLSFNFSGSRVLLVEDNEFNQQLAMELLQETGAMVDMAVNGQEAVTMVTKGNIRYDLVLMDIQMPVMDGYEATRLIREDSRFRSLPIIAMTAHAMQEEQQTIMQAGMDAHIVKPIDSQTMLRTMASFLGIPGVALPACDLPPVVAAGTEPAIPAFAGLDSALGLKRLAGDRPFYLRSLRFFVETRANDAALIEAALREGDTEQAQRFAHSMKSCAGTIGALELQEVATRLESALGHDKPPAIAREELARFAAELERLVLGLTSHLPTAPQADETLSGPVDGAVVTSILSKLLDLIHENSGKVERYLDEYQTELTGLPGKDIAQIRTHLNNFNFMAASNALLALAAKNGIILTSNHTGIAS